MAEFGHYVSGLSWMLLEWTVWTHLGPQRGYEEMAENGWWG